MRSMISLYGTCVSVAYPVPPLYAVVLKAALSVCLTGSAIAVSRWATL